LKSPLQEHKAALQRLGVLGFGLGNIGWCKIKGRSQLNLRT
jgi:hypothetical protein